jgi:hypothetical protein
MMMGGGGITAASPGSVDVLALSLHNVNSVLAVRARFVWFFFCRVHGSWCCCCRCGGAGLLLRIAVVVVVLVLVLVLVLALALAAAVLHPRRCCV